MLKVSEVNTPCVIFSELTTGISASGCDLRFTMITLTVHVSLLSLKISKFLSEKDLQALKNAPGSTRTSCKAQGTLFSIMWQPAWEASLGESGYMDMLAESLLT